MDNIDYDLNTNSNIKKSTLMIWTTRWKHRFSL